MSEERKLGDVGAHCARASSFRLEARELRPIDIGGDVSNCSLAQNP